MSGAWQSRRKFLAGAAVASLAPLPALAKRQKADGSFQNTAPNWMESDPNLATGYSLMALSYCKKK